VIGNDRMGDHPSSPLRSVLIAMAIVVDHHRDQWR
jgi:hypothetical protein